MARVGCSQRWFGSPASCTLARWWHRDGPNARTNPCATRGLGGMRNVLIVGAGGLGHRLASYLEKHPEMGRAVCGFVDDWKPLGDGVIGRISELARLARAGFVDELILAEPHDREKTLRVLRAAQQLRLDVKMAPDLFGCEPTRETERVGGIPLISLHEEQLPVAGLLLKRTLDVVGAGAALILMAPALALLAILVRLDSPGPVLYAALRAGRKGRPFRCYKFRTMVRDADALKERLAGAKSEAGSVLQNHRRSANHADRTTTAPLQSGRTSAALERDDRRDEPGGAATASAG